MQNPFQYGKVVQEPYFTDRKQELVEIRDNVLNQNNFVLYSPRRYGKTSILFKASQELKKQGYHTIYIDFYRVSSKLDFIELCTKAIFKEYKKPIPSLLKKISSLIRGIVPSISFDLTGNPVLSINVMPGSDISQTLEDTLNLTEILDKKSKWLVVFDEFQEITKLNGDRFDNLLRSVIQFHKNTSYIFSGSKHHLLLNLFNKPESSFYRFGKIMQLHKINPEFMCDFLIERFRSTEVSLSKSNAEEIILRVDNIPNYVQFLASEVWLLVQGSDILPSTEILDVACQNILDNLQDYFYQIWEGLSNYQQKVICAISQENTNPFTLDFQNKYHLSATSTTQRAINKLLESEILQKNGAVYSFTDPLFKLFIKLRILVEL